MLITSHLAATLALVPVVGAHGPEFWLALLGGVGVDLDHLFVNTKWIRDIRIFFAERRIERGVNQHSPLQELFFGVATASLIGVALHALYPTVRWWILPFFLATHIALDGIMKCEHQPFAPFNRWSYWGFMKSGTIMEFVVSLIVLVSIFLYQESGAMDSIASG
jgi:hypothetical protein